MVSGAHGGYKHSKHLAHHELQRSLKLALLGKHVRVIGGFGDKVTTLAYTDEGI